MNQSNSPSLLGLRSGVGGGLPDPWLSPSSENKNYISANIAITIAITIFLSSFPFPQNFCHHCHLHWHCHHPCICEYFRDGKLDIYNIVSIRTGIAIISTFMTISIIHNISEENGFYKKANEMYVI